MDEDKKEIPNGVNRSEKNPIAGRDELFDGPFAENELDGFDFDFDDSDDEFGFDVEFDIPRAKTTSTKTSNRLYAIVQERLPTIISLFVAGLVLVTMGIVAGSLAIMSLSFDMLLMVTSLVIIQVGGALILHTILHEKEDIRAAFGTLYFVLIWLVYFWAGITYNSMTMALSPLTSVLTLSLGLLFWESLTDIRQAIGRVVSRVPEPIWLALVMLGMGLLMGVVVIFATYLPALLGIIIVAFVQLLLAWMGASLWRLAY